MFTFTISSLLVPLHSRHPQRYPASLTLQTPPSYLGTLPYLTWPCLALSLDTSAISVWSPPLNPFSSSRISVHNTPYERASDHPLDRLPLIETITGAIVAHLGRDQNDGPFLCTALHNATETNAAPRRLLSHLEFPLHRVLQRPTLTIVLTLHSKSGLVASSLVSYLQTRLTTRPRRFTDPQAKEGVGRSSLSTKVLC